MAGQTAFGDDCQCVLPHRHIIISDLHVLRQQTYGGCSCCCCCCCCCCCSLLPLIPFLVLYDSGDSGVETVWGGGGGEEFRTQALARYWADRTSPCRDGIFLPGVPTHLARIMHRIHMDWWRVMFVPTP